MATGDRQMVYPASGALTSTSLASLASSTTYVAGAELTAWDNSTTKYLDARLTGKIRVGTTPTTATAIRVYVFGEIADGEWPDVMDGSDSAETWSNVEMRDASCKLAAVIPIVATTSDIYYPFDSGGLAALFGGVLPRKIGVYIAHSSVAALNATGSVVTMTGYTDRDAA